MFTIRQAWLSIRREEKQKNIPRLALNPLRARLPIDAIPKQAIHSLVESPNLKAVDLIPTLRSSSLSCTYNYELSHVPMAQESTFLRLQVSHGMN